MFSQICLRPCDSGFAWVRELRKLFELQRISHVLQPKKKVTDSFGGDLGHACFCLEIEQQFQVISAPPVFFQAKRCGLTCTYSLLFVFFLTAKWREEGGEWGSETFTHTGCEKQESMWCRGLEGRVSASLPAPNTMLWPCPCLSPHIPVPVPVPRLLWGLKVKTNPGG